MSSRPRCPTTRSGKTEIIEALPGVSAPLGPVFVSGPLPQTLPIIDYHRSRWASVKSGELGIEFVNSPHAVFRVQGPLNTVSLQSCVRTLTSRHSILKARVVDAPDGPEFVLNPERDITLEVIELSGAEVANKVAIARNVATERIWKPFGDAEPWLRIFAIRLGAAEHVVGFVIHHFIADAWSIDIASSELMGAYAAFEAGVPPSLPQLHLQYFDYVAGMNEWIRSEAARSSEAYWREYLRNAPPTCVPPDFHVASETVGAIEMESHHLPAEAAARLRLLSQSAHLSLHALVAAALIAVVARYSKAGDIVLLSRVFARHAPELYPLIGAFFDSLALRAFVTPDMSFKALATQVQRNMNSSSIHQNYPYHLVAASLPDIGASSIAPMLNFMNASGAPVSGAMQWTRAEPFELLPRPPIRRSARRYPGLYTEAVIDAAGLHCRTEYLGLMYKRETVSRFNQLLCRLLAAATHDPARSLSDLLAD